MIEVIIGIGIFILGLVASWFILKNKFEIQFNALENEANIKLNSLKEQNDSLVLQYELKINSLNDKKDLEEAHLKDKLNILENSKGQMKVEFEHLATKIFTQNKQQSNDDIKLLLKPFKEQLHSFNTRVNDIYTDETKQRSSLLSEIQNLKDLNIKISDDAINLTKALKGENKTQGDWGEMILSKILEQTGLKEGREYSVQGSFTSEDGKRLRPDVIVHLPAGKDIVIDSKVSLIGYLKYIEAQNDDEKKRAVKDMLISLNSHIKDLSSKKYEDLKEVNSLDFVLMFIPIEGAFMLASNEDNRLFQEAFKNNIMLVSPSTLFVTLRTIENIWKVQDQNDNAQLIAKKAADLYDKFEGFVCDMEELGKSIKKTKCS
ncbi:MAG: DNA recombination protein RmuC [Arcobacteraceae bacterium]|nr:DNA recombination protein RmuC [Arcobacteraceae bacterium]